MIELMVMFWLSGYAFFYGLALYFYSCMEERPPWWFYPLGLVSWPFMLGVQCGKIVVAIIVEEEDES